MGNKDEKTFADLFSSSTSEEKKTEQNFNDILSSEKTDDTSVDKGITFDSLFDSVKDDVISGEDDTEVKSSELEKKESFNDIDSKINENTLFESNIENSASNEGLNFNSIFDNIGDVLEEKEVKNTEIANGINNNLFFDNGDASNNGGIFDKNELENKEEVSFFESVSFTNNENKSEVENTKEAVDLSNNLFFGNEAVSENDSVLENDKIKDKKEEVSFFENVQSNENEVKEEIENAEKVDDLNKNIFFGTESVSDENDSVLENNEIEDKKEEVSILGNVQSDENGTKEEVGNTEEANHLNNNIFFGIEAASGNDVVLENNEIEDKKEEVSFFDNVKSGEDKIKKEEENTEEVNDFNNNIFFGTEAISGNDVVLENNEIEDKKEEKSILESVQSGIEDKVDEEINISTSPFFEESSSENEEPINVFFQNKINLIENNTPSISNSNIKLDTTKHFNVKIVKKKEPLFKFILGVFSYAIFIWLLLIGITLLVYVLDIKIRAAKGDYSTPTFNAYVVLTGSMLPDIQVSDVVITKKVDAKDLKKGDIITFASADSRFRGTIITHRIIKKNPAADGNGYTFQTKGDNNNVADSALVPENNIYGKVILKIPKLGYLQEFLASDGGWIIVILIPCLVVISYDVVKLSKGLKRKKYKNIKVQK